jgi:serralysin
MATVSDITTTPLSGLNYIDALLDTGPDWNYLTNSSGTPITTLTYTFSVASGNEDAASAQKNFTGSAQAFSASQQDAARAAFAYISKLTGIQFAETSDGNAAQIHLADVNLITSNVTGLCSWQSSYGYSDAQLSSYDADAYVYLDNVEWNYQNANLAPGSQGYETLLHELGHSLGLKHPFEDGITLPASEDNTSNTLMSYTDVGGPYSTYRQDDIAALMWLYGDDGLRGTLGINSTTGAHYLVGTAGADVMTGTGADDKLEGDGGNDMIDGGAGTDTAVFRGVRSNYSFSALANGNLQVTSTDGSDGVDTLHSIEVLQFANGSVSSADVVNADTTAPGAPTLAVTKNANGYAAGSTPAVTGAAEANATVKVYTADNTLVGTTTADATGVWGLTTKAFADGTGYSIYATATDAAGNTSAASGAVTFNIDAHAPVIPVATLSYTDGGNQATFSGTGEAGTTIELIRGGDFIDIATTTVGADGKWSVTTSPLPNASYTVSAVSVDLADNATSAANTMGFTVASSANLAGTTGNDKLTATAGNNAIDGQAGIDTVVYAAARADYTVAKETWGYGVTDKVGAGGHDAVINVERLQFSDGAVALDISGSAGQAFRLYQAALDRPAESAGLGFWIYQLDHGLTLDDMVQDIINTQPEFIQKYGSNPTDAQFVDLLYANVLHRSPDAAGYDFWVKALTNHDTTHVGIVKFFSESPENQAQVIGSIQDGIAYTPWGG